MRIFSLRDSVWLFFVWLVLATLLLSRPAAVNAIRRFVDSLLP